MTGIEPATLGTTIRCSNQLSYNRHTSPTIYSKILYLFKWFLNFLPQTASYWFGSTFIYNTYTKPNKKTNGSKFHKKNTVVCITDRLHSITLGLSIWKRWEPPSYRDWYNKYSITVANTSLSPTIQTEVQNPDYRSLLFDIRTQYWNPMVWNSRWPSICAPPWSCNRWNE